MRSPRATSASRAASAGDSCRTWTWIRARWPSRRMPIDDRLAAVGYSEATTPVRLRRIGDGAATAGTAMIAEEVPVAIVYNGRPHVVVMATPCDLEDLAYGFSITEGIVGGVDEVEHVEVVKASHGIELQVQIPPRAADELDMRARNLVARTGCGL